MFMWPRKLSYFYSQHISDIHENLLSDGSTFKNQGYLVIM